MGPQKPCKHMAKTKAVLERIDRAVLPTCVWTGRLCKNETTSGQRREICSKGMAENGVSSVSAIAKETEKYDSLGIVEQYSK